MRRPGQGEALAAGAVEGEAPRPAPVSRPKLRLPPSHNFVFLAHPAMWDVVFVDGSPSIAPRLRQFHYEPGVAGVEAVKGEEDGRPDRALAELARRGWTAVTRDREVTAHGKTFPDYVRRYEGQRGPVHLSVWRQPYIRGGEVIIDFDDEGWAKFLVDLVDQGVVAGPDRQARRALEVAMRTALGRYRTAAEKSAAAMECAEVYEAKLGAFRLIRGGRSEPAVEPVVEPAWPQPDIGSMIQAAVERALAESEARHQGELAAARQDAAKAEAEKAAKAKREKKPDPATGPTPNPDPTPTE